MICNRTKSMKRRDFPVVLIVIALMVLAGCASSHKDQPVAGKNVDMGEDRLTPETITPKSRATITAVRLLDHGGELHVRVTGDRTLSVRPEKRQNRLVLVFRNTDINVTPPVVPADSSISAIRASRLVDDRRSAVVDIRLKRNLGHSIKSEGDTVVAAFKKPAGARNEPPVTAVFSEYRPRQPQRFQFGLNQTTPRPPTATGDTYNAAYVPAYGPAARATQIDSVYATKLQDSLKIFIGADGAISEFESFTTQSPPRIIFDIFGVRSPYEREKRIPVNTRWVKEIRYAGHPGKLRLVLETTPAYLSA